MSDLINRLSTTQADFDERLEALLAWDESADEAVNRAVKSILADVKSRGDAAVLEYTRQFDALDSESLLSLVWSRDDLHAALARIADDQRWALKQAAERIERYHQHQLQSSWRYTEDSGTVLGQQIRAMDRVGMYVPGGKAAYPSSVLMTAIPAKVAGVEEVVMVTPTPRGQTNDIVLAAAAVAGVDRVIAIGGAQAVAAMAYGTETVPKVDKIVGPGNIYVATAKREVFGRVDIDMIAGPSEILVLCDGRTDPEWVAMDLFSQAEHDEDAQSILLCPDLKYIERVEAAMAVRLPELARREIAAASLRRRGALIHINSLQEGIELANRIAPEHLELSVTDPETWLPQVRHAGAIFMGAYTSEALGDYCAGPNHVLPTSGTARFSSPLGVYDFQKRSSLIGCSASAAGELGKVASILARGESLEAHALAAELRNKG